MNKLFRKCGQRLAGTMVVLCGLAMPAMASAGTWMPAGAHTITSPALSVAIPAVGGGWTCHAAFAVAANGTSALTVTSATFSNCSGTDAYVGCDVNALQGSGPDWVVNGATTSAITVSNVNVNVTFEPSAGCLFSGTAVNVAGTLATGGYNNTTHSLSLTGSTGLSGSIVGSPLGPVTFDGGLTDAAGTLALS